MAINTSVVESEKSREELIALRNERLKERFNHLYNVERIRYDDCIAKLHLEFFISKNWVCRILSK